MSKINFIIVTLLLGLLAACSKPSNGPSAAKGSSASDVVELDSSPLLVDINNAGTTSQAPSLEVAARKRTWNVRPLIIRNNSLEEQSVVIINSLDSNVEVEEDCPEEPAKLASRASCTFNIYFNRQFDKQVGFNQSVGSVSINGTVIPVSAVVTGDADIVEATGFIRLSKTAVNLGSLTDEQEKKDAITVLNRNPSQLPLYYDDLSAIGSGFSGTTNCPSSGSMLVSRKACVITFTQSGEDAGPGDYDVAIEVAGKTIMLESSVTAAPVFTSNPQLTWLNPLSSPSFSMEEGMNESYTFNIENRSLSTQSLFAQDFELGSLSLWPDAFSSSNSCSPVLSRRNCSLSLTFDPDRFHFGVVFEKEAFIKDEAVTITLTGNSPCNPDHPNARPDAAYGKKLNANKTACIDNVGVFDDPDSVYGHAVFQ